MFIPYRERIHKIQIYNHKFVVNETKRRTEFQFYWYYDPTCFGQPFCPSSGVLRSSILLLVANGHQICKMYQRRYTAKNS